MKHWKKIFAVVFAVTVLCVGSSNPARADASGFEDVPENAWYHDYVYDLVERGVISGTSETTFSPEKQLTRAQFATMLAKSALTDEELEQYRFQGSFKDVPESHWANRFINWAEENGIVSGYGNGTFGPNKPVTRQQMAVMVANFARAMCRGMSPINEAMTFKDSASIAGYALPSVQVCQRAGVINGYTDGTFRPNGVATRAEAASLYSNFLSKCIPSDKYIITRKRILGTAVRAVEFDPTGYRPDLLMGRDVADGKESAVSMVERSKPFVALNAAFFDMDNYESLGTLIKDGRVVTTMERFAPGKTSLTVDTEGHYLFENFATTHTVTLHREDGTDSVLQEVVVNRWPSSDKDGARILFTRDWGHKLCFPAADAVTLAEDGTILAIDHNKDVEIPETGYVLAQRSRRKYEGDFFDSCQVGMVLDVERLIEGASTANIRLSIGSGPRLVKDGVACTDTDLYRAEGFTDDSHLYYKTVRVCLGIKPDGKIIVLSAYSTMAHLAEVLVHLGCENAINFDGGGSSTIYVDGFWLRGPQDRALNNMLIFTKE